MRNLMSVIRPAGVMIVLMAGLANPAAAQDAYLGEIRWVGFNFAPVGWAECNGQLLPISQNTSLFALLGTTYGGNGQTTFALPDMRGRVMVHMGMGPGLSNRDLGRPTITGCLHTAITFRPYPFRCRRRVRRRQA
jgi:hypothetical protein